MAPMGGWRVGRFFGIDVYLSPTWFVLFGLVVYMLTTSGFGDPAFGLSKGNAFLASIITAVLMFAGLLAHEYGHALTARAFGIPTRHITLFLFGGVASIEREPKTPFQELLIAIAGPAVSVLLAILFGGAALVTYLAGGPVALQQGLGYLVAINASLAIFNFLPGFPMDGGRVLRAAVWGATDNYLLATRVASTAGRVIGAGLMSWGIMATIAMLAGYTIPVVSLGSPWLIFIGWYLTRLAKMSLVQAEVVSAFNGLTVKDLMRPVRVVVPRDWAVSDFAPLFAPPNQIDQLPVIDGDRLVGALKLAEVLNVPKRQWDWVKADELAKPFDVGSMLSPGTDAFSAFLRIVNAGLGSMPVFEGRRLLGYVFRADLASRMPERMGGLAR